MARATSSSPAFHELDRAVVCGLIHERGEAARSATYDAAWECDIETWRQVQKALDDARDGIRPASAIDEAPRWLARLVRDRLADLAERRVWDNAFETIRALERLRLIDLQADDTYVLAVVSTNGDRFAPLRADYLRADPELRENVVWRMFEVEGGGEISLANVDKYSHEKNGWKQAFLDLTADSTLPRPRVLTAALDALNRDFSAYRAGWYARLYDALSPTAEEQAGHQERFRRLLRSEVAATVKLAVARLQAVSKAGLLDDAATVPALPPALLVPVKGTAVAAVRLLADIADRTPALAGQVTEAAATALGHPHADVQQAAAKLLSQLGADHLVSAAAEDLEPSVRADLGQSLKPSDEEVSPVAPPAVPPRALVPAGPDDVLDRFAALLEDAGDPVELELVLSGLAASKEPAVLRPLLKRARNVLSRGPRDAVFQGWLRGHLAGLVLRSAGEEEPPTLPTPNQSIGFLVRRLDEVAAVLAGKAPPRRLLATPNGPAGWVRPTEFAERLATTPTAAGRYDLIGALLRLHPDGRPAALEATTGLTGRLPEDVLAAVRYALGGPPPSKGLERASDIAMWVAASRSRAPLADDTWLLDQGIRGAGRSGALTPRLDLVPEATGWTDDLGVMHPLISWYWSVHVEDAAPGLPDDEPTATTGRGQRPDFEAGWEDIEDFVGWQALIWPHDAERFLIDAVHPVLETATTHEVRHDAVRVLDALYRHPGRLGPLSWITLAAGLTAARADERARAVDAVLHFADAGRLTAAQLARGLADMAGLGTPTRWAGSLKDVAGAGPAGRRLVIAALGAALPEFDPARRGLHALLQLLREELLREQAATPALLRPWLAQFSGSSRTAAVARALAATKD
ncbi:DUF6493 family protein [Blastococcus sp. SYSU DS0617]